MQWLWGGKLQQHFRMSDASRPQLYLLQDRLGDGWSSSSKSLFASAFVFVWHSIIQQITSPTLSSITETGLKESSVTSAEQHSPIPRTEDADGYISHIKAPILSVLLYTDPTHPRTSSILKSSCSYYWKNMHARSPQQRQMQIICKYAPFKIKSHALSKKRNIIHTQTVPVATNY